MEYEGKPIHYVQTTAQTRFSDFCADGKLHFSKCLMYFEKARFAIAKDAGLDVALEQSFPGLNVNFLVIKVTNNYLKPVPVYYDRNNAPLVVRSSLVPPFVSKLSFQQELVDGNTGEVFIRSQIDVALWGEGMGLISNLPELCETCLQNYLAKMEEGTITL